MKAQPMTFYLPDTRGVEISRYGRGNRKIGMDVFTYSRIAGDAALGEYGRTLQGIGLIPNNPGGTCPGSTPECEAICYAKRIVGPVRDGYARNAGADVPPIPSEAKLLRIHVSGDFDTPEYIWAWIARLQQRLDVKAWAYTRSWRVQGLLTHLERLRALPNMQLFASMDASCEEMPPAGWRRAWLDRSWDKAMETDRPLEHRLMYGLFGRGTMPQSPFEGGMTVMGNSTDNTTVISDGTPSYVCPEETGRKADCESCRYCFDGRQNDVTFLEH